MTNQERIATLRAENAMLPGAPVSGETLALAVAIFYIVTHPCHVAINEFLVLPTEQEV